MTVRVSEVSDASGGGLAIRPNSPQVLARDEHGGVHVLASDGIASAFYGGACPRRRTLQRQGAVAIATATGVRLVDGASGSVLGTIDGPPATMLAFSGDGTRLAIESGDREHRGRRCGDAETGRAAGDTRALPRSSR